MVSAALEDNLLTTQATAPIVTACGVLHDTDQLLVRSGASTTPEATSQDAASGALPMEGSQRVRLCGSGLRI